METIEKQEVVETIIDEVVELAPIEETKEMINVVSANPMKKGFIVGGSVIVAIGACVGVYKFVKKHIAKKNEATNDQPDDNIDNEEDDD